MHPIVLSFADLAVVVDNKIDFFMRNKTSSDSIVAKAWPLVQLSDLTYNDNNETIYAADADSSGIFSIELEEGKNISLSRFSDSKYKCASFIIRKIIIRRGYFMK